jgi:hypothetical protein
MKKVIFGLVLLMGFSAHAAQVPTFKCIVPAKTSTVTVNIAVSDSESVDFVTIDLNDKTNSILFMQMEKDGFQKQVNAGQITTLALGDQFQQGDDGVIRDAGVLALGLDNGKWSGLLSVKGNVYPLDCTKL